MNHIKKLCMLLTACCLMASVANAQDEEKVLVYPQLFVGVQSGIQTTLTDYNNWKLITPTGSLSLGAFFTPVVGARLHFNGFWNKGGYYDDTEDFKCEYKYLSTNIDLMVNMVTLIGKKNYYPLNLYLIGGLGLNCAWGNDDAYAHQNKMLLAYDNTRCSHNARLGVMRDYDVSKHVSINLEVSANNLNDRYNSRKSDKGDWQITTQLGVAYKFAGKKAK